MTTNIKFKSLLVVALLSGISSFATVSAGESVDRNSNLAPEATAAEADLSYMAMPLLKKAFFDATPDDRSDGITIGKLGVDGGDKDKIVKMAQEMADGKYGDYDSLLIAHKDKLLFESYFKRARINLPHPQTSAVKAYTSIALGRAIQMGYLTMADLDKPVISFLKDLEPEKFTDGAKKITLHQAMTMRSGLRISSDKMTELRENPAPLKGQGQVQTFLEYSAPITAESQSYLYQGIDPDLVMQVLDAVVPGTAKDFIQNELLNKIGITNYSWRTADSGLPEAGWRASMTSRAMVKLGTLVNNNGKRAGEQLISKKFLAKATSKITQPTEDWQPKTLSYGYFWHQTDLVDGDKSYDVNFAWGGGGQRIITIEELDLIVVITGVDMEDTKIMDQVAQTIIPAFVE